MWKPAISVLIFLATWTSPPPGRTAQPSQKMRIGYSTMSATTAPLWIAQDEGFLLKHGIDSDLIFIPGPSIVVAALNRGDVTLAMVGGSTVLAGAASGIDLKIIAAVLNRVPHDFVVRPEIKKPQDLQGKRVGVTALGGTAWMAAMFALNQVGLNAEKDHITLSSLGDQRLVSQALESGTVDAGLLTGTFSLRLKRMGFGFLGDIDRIQLLSGGIVATAGTLKSDPSLVKGVLRALLAAHAFIVDTKNRPKVLTTIMKRLGTNDRTVAEDGLDDLIRRTDSKPYPSLNGLTNIQRFMQLRNPKVAAVNVAELIDDSLIREVDRAGRD
jgi:ABC-type nitrate/sulfonate/bicarbonate transport system substrate-binding protein